MRRRSTFITHPSRAVNPDDIQVYKNQLLLGGLKAAREERLTLGFEELPEEVVQLLRESHELHLRWAGDHTYDTTAPFLSRISPGLHIQYTPLRENQASDRLCELLHNVFDEDLRCDTPRTTFISPPLVSERFAQTASLQYYSLLPSVKRLAAYLQRKICKPSDLTCIHTASLLNLADAIDFDYDSISHALTLTVLWSKQPQVIYDPIGEFTTLDAWNLDIQSKHNEKVEVGILNAAPAAEPSDLQLSGFLTVVGEDDRPKATLFSFPSRHHSLSAEQRRQQQYIVSFDKPTGLHPVLKISFPDGPESLTEPTNRPAGSVCALQTYLTLPSQIFADKYAFLSNDPLFQKSHNIGQLHSIAGETDLEAPDYVVKKWGSTMLLEIRTIHNTDTSTSTNSSNSDTHSDSHTSTAVPWDVTIPLHLRYLEPQNGGSSEVQIPWPIVFWACTAEEGTKFPVNPFDRTQLGYDALFGPRTMFYHLDPAPRPESGGKLVERISVPVLDAETATSRTIEVVTLITIALGFLWVLLRLRSSFLVLPMSTRVSKAAEADEKKKR
ncbi:protease B nonderepressible form [Exophiala xenobiotica]|uniref:Protein PBN1 n=1 Tax=Vermiconidia calcicola TaxID=1690605 RepID=A0AAV9Q6F3_9PEZI|nr:protease B nonderepressible form [Exophiala xenobiotica]KAK5536487.1 protease B nonderepressible form [Vermiconidia calcicola]KAK5543372.1 protease B nonderepressible form [Chaetothyriales sp. CCFEE 6169]KAK5306029.1 protease B nonderepressible form [Exophiala xenobiotica]KAK5322035.1 protease B nonderepressible form [Exophiala xenobiotica]